MKYILIIYIIFSFHISNIFAQEEIPTSAPSKTPTTFPTQAPTQETQIIPTSETRTNTQKTFTQEDLSILSGNVQRPNGITWYNNNLYTSCSGDWTLYKIDDTTGSTITFTFGIRNAHTLLLEESEAGFDIWIPDFDTNTLYKTNQNQGSPITITRKLNGPWGITKSNNDTFLVTNLRGNNIVQITEDGAIEELTNELRSPAGIVAHNEYIYFANAGSSRRSIEWFRYDNNVPKEAIETKSLVSGLQNTTNIILGNDDHLYFTYALGTRGVVGRVNPEECQDEGCTNEDVEVVLFTDLPAPLAGLTISDDMRLFIHTIYRPEIYWVQLEI